LSLGGDKDRQVIIITVDSREQKPLELKSENITKVIRKKLNVGDYSCQFEDGHIVPIVFERKGVGDLFSTMGTGYKRFKREMTRAQESNTSLIIIIEGTMTKVAKGYSHSRLPGSSVIKKLFTLQLKYGVPTVYCKDREEMQNYIVNFFEACGRLYLVRKRENG